MDVVGHLTLLSALCAAVMAPAAIIDAILENKAKEQLYSQIKRHNFVFIKNREFLFDVLKSILRSKERQAKLCGIEIAIIYPNLRRFTIIHFFLVTTAALVIIPGSEPFIHEVHPKAERTGWIIGAYQVHTMIFVEWISLYITTVFLSFPLDFLSATKTLSLATWASKKSRRIRLISIVADILITILLVSISLLILGILLANYLFDLPETIYRFMGGAPIWLSHEDLFLPRLFHAAFVVAAVTALVLIVTLSMHLASMMWFLLDKLRVYRFFAIQYLRLESLPFTIAAFTMCVVLVCLYLFVAIAT